MPDEISAIFELQFAAQRRKRAEEARRVAVSELRERVIDAHEASVPVTRIAREAGVSRQAVYEMLGLRRLSSPHPRTPALPPPPRADF
jgi:hypothetical protein